ncbi:ABC transporter permease [Mycoplasmatota bacterium WC44]
MKKYLFILKTALKEQLQYLGNLLGGFIVFGLIVFVFLSLWKYIYSGQDVIHGYTINQLIWYIIMTELILFSARSYVITGEIKDDIKSGKIAYLLNKPYDYVIYIISKHFGTIIPNVISFTVFGFIIGNVYIGKLVTFKIEAVPFILITLLFGVIVITLIYILIGLSSFWIEETSPFKWIFSKLLVVLGITFPIEFFPKGLATFVKYSPVYAITYAPAKMLVDFSFDVFVDVVLAQGFYIVGLSLIITYVYSKGVRRVNVNGG